MGGGGGGGGVNKTMEKTYGVPLNLLSSALSSVAGRIVIDRQDKILA